MTAWMPIGCVAGNESPLKYPLVIPEQSHVGAYKHCMALALLDHSYSDSYVSRVTAHGDAWTPLPLEAVGQPRSMPDRQPLDVSKASESCAGLSVEAGAEPPL